MTKAVTAAVCVCVCECVCPGGWWVGWWVCARVIVHVCVCVHACACMPVCRFTVVQKLLAVARNLASGVPAPRDACCIPPRFQSLRREGAQSILGGSSRLPPSPPLPAWVCARDYELLRAPCCSSVRLLHCRPTRRESSARLHAHVTAAAVRYAPEVRTSIQRNPCIVRHIAQSLALGTVSTRRAVTFPSCT